MRSPFAFLLLLVFVLVDRGSCFDDEELVIVTEPDDTPSFSSAETYFPSPPSQFPSSLLPTKENTQAFLPIKPPFTDKGNPLKNPLFKTSSKLHKKFLFLRKMFRRARLLRSLPALKYLHQHRRAGRHRSLSVGAGICRHYLLPVQLC